MDHFDIFQMFARLSSFPNDAGCYIEHKYLSRDILSPFFRLTRYAIPIFGTYSFVYRFLLSNSYMTISNLIIVFFDWY